MAVFRLLHLSDLHIAGEANRYSLVDSYSPKISFLKCLGRGQSPLKIPSHDARAARALARQIVEDKGKYDAILISGDLATTGSEEDIKAAHDYFHGKLWHTKNLIDDIPKICDVGRVIWMPGNHDRYEGNSFKPGCKRFEQPNFFGGRWRREGQFQTDLGKQDGPVHSYHLKKDNSYLTIICADFTYQESHPDLWLSGQNGGDHIGQGYVADEVLSELERVTNASRNKFENTAIVWVSHFPPQFPRVATSLKLVNDERLLELADKLCISVIFSGHTHEAMDYPLTSGSQNVRIICCGTTLEHQANDPKLCLQIIGLEVLSSNQINIALDRKFWREDSGGIGKFC
jgi:3',5'-cyclic AMP phosphodiesterase CpdA